MDLPAGTENSPHTGTRPRSSVLGRSLRGQPRFAAAVTVLLAAAVFTATNASAVPVGAATAGAGGVTRAGVQSVASSNRSGLPWLSGASLASETPRAAANFGAWRHRKLDVMVVWPQEATWSDIIDPAWLYRQWKGSPIILVLSEPMLPTGVPGVSIKACANGAYNSYWKNFGTNISSYGLGTSIIRLGWEFNGGWYRWAAWNPAVWAECWRQVVTAARSTAPGLRWDWNVNRGVSSALANPASAYPGNAYVNMIGIDSYDWWLPVSDPQGWNEQLNGKQGLNYWLAFAKAHGKKLSVPEWANARYGKSAGGDDPQYVKDMKAFFSANTRYLAFEAICQQSGLGWYAVGRLMPQAAAMYRTDF